MKSSRFSKTIGIIGGAGPMASCHLYQTILKQAHILYGANDYHEFPHIVLISFPFLRQDPKKIQSDLKDCLTRLKLGGADTIGLACNSFHAYLPESLDDGFIHLIELCVQRAKKLKWSKVLILAAPKTIEMKLYEREGLTCIYPHATDQIVINQIIREVASGKVTADQKNRLEKVIEKAEAVDGVFLACTELPLVHEAFPLETLPLLDTVEALACELLQQAKSS